MSQLVIKSPNLEYLKIDRLWTTPANRSALLEFAALATTNSSCLHTLHIELTYSTVEDGDKFMKILADDHINWLHHLTIWKESAWFRGRDECMDSLIILLAR